MEIVKVPPDLEPSPLKPTLVEAFWVWCRVALLSFGGPAGQIAVMHRILVEEKKWFNEEQFFHALHFCMVLPGPEAHQLATYTGWLLHRTLGGILAGTLFVLPGFLAILFLSILYTEYQQTTLVTALFFGLKPAVLAIVLAALYKMGKRVLKSRVSVLIAAGGFLALFLFALPFPLVILLASLVGLLFARHSVDILPTPLPGPTALSVSPQKGFARKEIWIRAVKVLICCGLLWFVPLLVIAYTLGVDSIYIQLGIFFSKVAVLTFGGAYAVLAYVARHAVETQGWLNAGEMLDGLGMAETTPGPLIMVVQFVGYLAAYRHPGPLSPICAGILGSLVTTWVTFVPCFLWIFLGGPHVEQLRQHQPTRVVLSAITAAVVGVILNLAVWFALHTLFGSVHVFVGFGLQVSYPAWNSIQWRVCLVALLSLWLTFAKQLGMASTLAVAASAGLVLYWLRQVGF